MKQKIIIFIFVILAVSALVYWYDTRTFPSAGLSENEARAIAENSCVKGGESLSGGVHDEIAKTWRFDANLNYAPSGCNPACAVSEETKTAKIDWRCTGLILFPEEISCAKGGRDVGACAQIYDPVCARVDIQCIKAPCYPVYETHPNACTACMNPLVESYTVGECANNN
jgi:hypothetical protein